METECLTVSGLNPNGHLPTETWSEKTAKTGRFFFEYSIIIKGEHLDELVCEKLGYELLPNKPKAYN